MNPRFYIESITYNNDQVLQCDKNDIIVFVGANNAGKSASLKEIALKFRSKATSSKIIKDIQIGIEGTQELFADYIEKNSIKNNIKMSSFYSEKGILEVEGQFTFLNNIWTKTGFWNYYTNNTLEYKLDFNENPIKKYTYYDKTSNKIKEICDVISSNNGFQWEGQKILYDIDGNLIEIENKMSNNLSVIGYYHNKKLIVNFEGNYSFINNQKIKVGLWNYYTEEGILEKTVSYSDNDIKVATYYTKGNIKYSSTINKNNNEFNWYKEQIFYYPNGIKSAIISLDETNKGTIENILIKEFYFK